MNILKAKQGTMKTLDGSIKREAKDGSVTSASMRCSELDQEVCKSYFLNLYFISPDHTLYL